MSPTDAACDGDCLNVSDTATRPEEVDVTPTISTLRRHRSNASGARRRFESAIFERGEEQHCNDLDSDESRSHDGGWRTRDQEPNACHGPPYDQETALTHFGAREYDAAEGRWIAKDPILYAGDEANLYSYVGGDPINLRDPSGYETAYSQSSAMVGSENMRKGRYAAAFEERRRVLAALCDGTRKMIRNAEEVHHIVFVVFGGEDGDENYIALPYEIHRMFHGMVNSALKAVTDRTIQLGAKDWAKELKDPAMRRKVKETLLEQAATFDLLCAGIGSVPYMKGTEPRWMFETMALLQR